MSTCTKCFVFTEKCQVCELEAKNGELEKKLKIAVEALRYMADLDDNNDGVKYREASEQALAAIKGDSNE